jgi:hypothetical protein
MVNQDAEKLLNHPLVRGRKGGLKHVVTVAGGGTLVCCGEDMEKIE